MLYYSHTFHLRLSCQTIFCITYHISHIFVLYVYLYCVPSPYIVYTNVTHTNLLSTHSLKVLIITSDLNTNHSTIYSPYIRGFNLQNFNGINYIIKRLILYLLRKSIRQSNLLLFCLSLSARTFFFSPPPISIEDVSNEKYSLVYIHASFSLLFSCVK